MMPYGEVPEDPADEFVIVHNDAGQYSVWWSDRDPPPGWHVVGEPDSRRGCLDRIGLLWTEAGPAGPRVTIGPDPR